MKYLALTLLLAICATAANWTDRKEYDLVLNIRAETSPQKRLGLLDQWKSEYPKSEYQQVRLELYLATYQALGDSPHTLSVAGEMLAAQPDNPVGAYWFTLLLPEEKSALPEQLALGEKASRQLLADPKPAGGVESMAHRTLGWIHWQRSEYTQAEEEFQKCLASESHRRRDIGLAGHRTGDRAAAGQAGARVVAACARFGLPGFGRTARRAAAPVRRGSGAPLHFLPRQFERPGSTAHRRCGSAISAGGV
jgi:tetratricopeptide (TPR) repeat protein